MIPLKVPGIAAPRSFRVGGLILSAIALSGCAALQQFNALQDVDFSLDGVSDVTLAGIDLSQVDSFDDIGLADLGTLAAAVGRNQVPMVFQLHVRAENPDENRVQARLTRFDWTLLLEGRETLSGAIEEEIILPSGEPTDIPILIDFNLMEFFRGNGRDLLQLALSFAGLGGEPKNVTLRATPIVDTPLGAIRYPRPITIVDQTVGG